MGSATYPVMGTKIQDMRQRQGGEVMYVRGGAASFGDVKMAGPLVTDAAISRTVVTGASNALMANVVPVAAGTSSVNLRLAEYRVCNESAGIIDDGSGHWLGVERTLCRCKVTTAGGAFTSGTPFRATDAQVHLTQADLAQNDYKIIFVLAGDQTLAAGVVLAEGYFDGVNGFGNN